MSDRVSRPVLIGVTLCAGLIGDPHRAVADSSEPLDLARGLHVEMARGIPVVSRAGVRAPLTRGNTFGYVFDEKTSQLDVQPENCWTFGEPEAMAFTLNMLEARVENAAALKLHRAKRHVEAAAGFRKALQLDGQYILAGYNLASALNLAGRPAEAAAALSPFLEAHRVKVYLAALQDAELTSLLSEPPLAALRTTPPGTATLRNFSLDFIAYSEKNGRLAVLDKHDGLRVFSVKTGALDAVVDLGNRVLAWSGDGGDYVEVEKGSRKTEQQADQVLAKKLPLVNQLLAELGFVEVTQREVGKLSGHAGEHSAQFSRSGVKLTTSGSRLRLTRNQQPLGELEHEYADHSLRRVIWLPAQKTLVWQWARSSGPTDCHRQTGTEIMISSSRATPR